MTKPFLFLLFFFFHTVCFGFQDFFLTTGHREAMMANGGSTDLCSPGQFVLNPAGLFCSTKTSKSESFGSTHFSAMAISTKQGNLNELGSGGLRTSPGLSLFSQGFYEDNSGYGFWGSINQFNFSKSYNFSQMPVQGNFDTTSNQSETTVGPFFTGKFGEVYWGLTLSIIQAEQKRQTFSKYSISGVTSTTNESGVNLEQLLGSRLGFIRFNEAWSYSLVIVPPLYSLHGSSRTDRTEIGTNNTFSETIENGTIRTHDSGDFILGTQYSFDHLKKWGFDISYVGASEIADDHSDYDQQSPATGSLGTNFQWILTGKISLLSGLRFVQTLNEPADKPKSSSHIVSFGILRTYKGVELGSAFAYNQFASHTPVSNANPAGGTTTMSKWDVTFSSSFTY